MSQSNLKKRDLVSPLLQLEDDRPEVPEDIKKSFQNHAYVIKVTEQQKKDIARIFGSEYSLYDNKKKATPFKVCPFCLELIESLQCVSLKSKTLNQIFLIHNHCYEQFLNKDSKHTLVQLHDTASVEYVLGEEEEEQQQRHSDNYKDALVELVFYHPISNRIIYETIKKTYIFQSENNEGICKFKLLEGYVLDPELMAIPYESFRLNIRVIVMDQQINTKNQIATIISSKKLKVLPADQHVVLKVTQKKCVYKINAQTKKLDAIKHLKISPWVLKQQISLINLNSIEICLSGLFQRKRKQTFLQVSNHSTYSQKGISKRKKEELDLSPDSRSIDKNVNIDKTPLNFEKDFSKSDISFTEHKYERQEREKSDNSRLSYISKQINIEELQNQISTKTMHLYLKTQVGSRMMQKYITNCKEQDVQLILGSIQQHIPSLILDQYANFFFKTLCEVCTPKNRIFILSKIHHHIEEIARDKKGTHSLQALVMMSATPNEENALIQSIEKHLLVLCKDEQGTHIIKKMLLKISAPKALYIFEKLKDFLFELATNQHGIIVVKELMKSIKDIADKRTTVFIMLEKFFEELIQNAYGNYAIQHAIDIFPIKECDKILNKIMFKIGTYSTQKISSNVVEKCIMSTNEVDMDLFQETKNKFLLAIGRDQVIVQLMKNKFGNFVLEKALKSSSKTQHKTLVKSMSKNIDSLPNGGMKEKWKDYLYDY